jgi:hypothetical protein
MQRHLRKSPARQAEADLLAKGACSWRRTFRPLRARCSRAKVGARQFRFRCARSGGAVWICSPACSRGLPTHLPRARLARFDGRRRHDLSSHCEDGRAAGGRRRLADPKRGT